MFVQEFETGDYLALHCLGIETLKFSEKVYLCRTFIVSNF
jgi:hypothetical protein